MTSWPFFAFYNIDILRLQSFFLFSTLPESDSPPDFWQEHPEVLRTVQQDCVMLICHTSVEDDFDHLVKVTSARFLHNKVDIFPSAISAAFEKDSFKICKWSVAIRPPPIPFDPSTLEEAREIAALAFFLHSLFGFLHHPQFIHVLTIRAPGLLLFPHVTIHHHHYLSWHIYRLLPVALSSCSCSCAAQHPQWGWSPLPMHVAAQGFLSCQPNRVT